MPIRFGNSDPNTSSGRDLDVLADNNNENWWSHGLRIPMKKGTHIKVVPLNNLWWLVRISEYSVQ